MSRSDLMDTVKAFFQSTSGATAIEYALIAGGISILIVGGVAAIGGTLTGIFDAVAALF